MFDEQSWEERYAVADALWSGQPNQHLVTDTADLTPGRALDAGCGEGADSIWLAERGWRVTGVDFATLALRRAAEHAAARGVGGKIDWKHADLTTWTPPVQEFDLVTAHFLHLPPAVRDPLYQRLADAVAPGGTLLIVAHHPEDMHGPVARPHAPEMFFTAEQVVDLLDLTGWDLQAVDARARQARGHEGDGITVYDTVLRARRSYGTG
ncbi:class I SAM-dependent methyltransferase [Actinokineospora sp. NBRC 105648]|uniref:class I SAM-dependent methyltransferase n=1 Tax=Actinokineospora sp. NBRC 105648 TaxID=3032206 RepID=UPI0024A1D4EC|nr:class I SAM-dependent methyltransferase [Actinokineospora sp. NBRC 105648]GLZ42756.1 hypothetical protein Acsp05_63800 [Actinokineospora sp. NBRC 105648]